MLIHRRFGSLALAACVASIAAIPACGGDDDSSAPAGGSSGAGGASDAGPDGQSGGGTGGSGGTGVGGGGAAGDAGEDAPPLPPDATAVLQIHPMDIWAQYLPGQDYTVEVTESGTPVAYGGSPTLTVPLVDASTLTITLSAPEHHTLEVSVEYDGTGTLSSATLFKAAGSEAQGVAFGHENRDIEGKTLPVHSLYLGLRHRWFSAQGRPARRGNDIELLMDGEEAWGSVHEDLSIATDRILVSTWWWESNFELIRHEATHHTLDPSERWSNTILGVLEARPAHKRVLVGQFWGSGDRTASWIG